MNIDFINTELFNIAGIQELFLHLPVIGGFAIIFGLIVLLPKISERFGLPGILGLLVGGIVLGPEFLGIITPEGKVLKLFGELGKLLLMFFAGYEINLTLFRKSGAKAVGFGLLTFTVPMAVGTLVGLFFNYSMNASVLIGSLMASHTLLGLPIVKKLGLVNKEETVVAVGATIFTDVASMLVLAVCLSIHSLGFSSRQLIIYVIELAIYVPVVVFGFSWAAKQLFKRYSNEELRLSILLLIVCAGALLAEIIHLEGIVGAFLSGIAVNRALDEEDLSGRAFSIISHTLFIPVFFLTTGFLVDFKIFAATIRDHTGMVLLVVGGLLCAKFLAATAAGLFYRYKTNETLYMWSLTVPQVAATLAATIVAYNTVNAGGERLLSEAMLNAVVVLVIVTSIVGPMLTKKYGERIQDKVQP